ncbi:MAG: acyl-CoA dehydrogenase family protein [SAR86 cluster bacterium]|jgi:alkylation response protein AidB-like acyl-CoA dehydrogenase|nr:acyl-CoA dehydrogenase family protein [SAR86 cluster bacterium]MCS5548052.1 acyl-CoA dehydrogenase family protein [SAR86 cluster bacterium]GIS75082.1 MAG: acyl-CoA dehydrogenase [Gammaproteobacteria bacterium]|tara:strand:- start:782 stop:1972 length:1191 start_codon:yes stop_codon:yes gene_type:complete
MDLTFSKEDLDFQAEVRDFLTSEYPLAIKEKQDKRLPLEKEDIISWQKILASKGWFAINWPKEYGGAGLTPTQIYILQTELAGANTPILIPFGVNMCGPVIYTFGTEEQKKKYLPGILNSDTWWCQGYSEPGSGSDLASLQTKAELKGDNYLVNGTKTWTTLAQHADWVFCLVRTETTDIKQEGISFLLIDMKSKGIEVKPIITIDGAHEVNMIYFDDVEVPANNLIGEEGEGWNIAKFLLMHERTGIAGIAALKRELKRLKEISSDLIVGEASLLDDANFRNKIEAAEIELTATEFTELRTLSQISSGGAPGPESSILKIKGTELQQSISELFIEMLGYYAHPFLTEAELGSNASIGPDYAGSAMPHYLNFRKVSIYGGSNEIQRNVISKAILGL